MNFFTYLTNGTSQQQMAVGSDFISENWQPRRLVPEMAAVRRALFVDPTRPEAVNWGAWSICRLLPSTDLASLLGRFTGVSEYVPVEMLAVMADQFRPRLTDPAVADKIRLTPQVRTEAYRLHTITVAVSVGEWTVSTGDNTSLVGPVSPSGIESAVIYGKNTLMFPSRVDGSWQLSFASPGTRTLADVANDLRTVTKPSLTALQRLPSMLTDDDKAALVNACHAAYEPAITVCAAALLLAGATSVSPVDAV